MSEKQLRDQLTPYSWDDGLRQVIANRLAKVKYWSRHSVGPVPNYKKSDDIYWDSYSKTEGLAFSERERIFHEDEYKFYRNLRLNYSELTD